MIARAAGTEEQAACDQLFGSERSYVLPIPPLHAHSPRNERPSVGGHSLALVFASLGRVLKIVRRVKKKLKVAARFALSPRGGRESSLSNSVNKIGYFIQISGGRFARQTQQQHDKRGK